MKTLTNPYSLFDLMKLDLDSTLEKNLFPTTLTSKKIYSNIKEMEEYVLLELVVPGFKKNEIEITLENNGLLVKGKKEEKNTEKYILNEYSFATEFSRNFKINPNVDMDSISSQLEDGVLTIKVPRLKKAETKKVIQIK